MEPPALSFVRSSPRQRQCAEFPASPLLPCILPRCPQIQLDLREEAGKYGTVAELVVPRGSATQGSIGMVRCGRPTHGNPVCKPAACGKRPCRGLSGSDAPRSPAKGSANNVSLMRLSPVQAYVKFATVDEATAAKKAMDGA